MICPNKPLASLENYRVFQQQNLKYQEKQNEVTQTKHRVNMEPNGFQKIYMANIPNSRLDLSFIETRKENQPPKPPENFFVEEKHEDTEMVKQSFVAFGSYKEFKKKRPNVSNSAKKVSFLNQNDDRKQLELRSDEPTVRDLLKIIQQQNEQLLLLQKQVACLIENKNQPPANVKQIEREEFLPPKVPNRFAIDVMTSFEVSIRPQQQQQNTLKELLNKENEVKIKEITETAENDDLKLSTLSVREECPSPENSVHVDMQDYSSE